MNKVKQMLGIILSVVIVLSCVPVAAYADSVVEIYNGDTQVTDLIYLQEYRSAELSAKISSEVSGETTVEWVSNLPLLADVDENGKVTAYDYSKRAVTRKECTSGCIACKKCERLCPAQAITVNDNLAVIDIDKCTGCGVCSDNCPVGCIKSGTFLGANNSKQ